jgi:glutathionyl-hydroquinone reductase
VHLYPSDLAEEIDKLNDWVYDSLLQSEVRYYSSCVREKRCAFVRFP